MPGGQEIVCHFSQGHALVTKILEFIHKHPNQKVVKSFFHYLDRFFRNLAETNKKLGFFLYRKSQNQIFQLFYHKIL